MWGPAGDSKPADPRSIPVYTVQYLIIYIFFKFLLPLLCPPPGRKSGYGPDYSTSTYFIKGTFEHKDKYKKQNKSRKQ